jgi:1,4-dihydroxy-2-naphthoate octaprenyltransferase
MFSKSTWLHLRIPFSFFLLPVYLFALSISPNFSEPRIVWSFIIIHFFLYPASNGYNSYFDKDEKSIGGLKNPPPVNKGLYQLSLLLDLLAVVLAFIKVNALFAAMIFIYGFISKAYSHPSIRLKKYPFGSWLLIFVFQGFFSLLMCYVGINGFGFSGLGVNRVILAGILSSILIGANYPLTQVYQHEEDEKHGDKTISRWLGIRGTFWFTLVVFLFAVPGYVLFFKEFFSIKYSLIFLMALSPVMAFFLYWFYGVLKDETKADFSRTMKLNFISALCLNAFFLYFFLDSTQVIQAIKAGY